VLDFDQCKLRLVWSNLRRLAPESYMFRFRFLDHRLGR
jgi:hypothetical protein